MTSPSRQRVPAMRGHWVVMLFVGALAIVHPVSAQDQARPAAPPASFADGSRVSGGATLVLWDGTLPLSIGALSQWPELERELGARTPMRAITRANATERELCPDLPAALLYALPTGEWLTDSTRIGVARAVRIALRCAKAGVDSSEAARVDVIAVGAAGLALRSYVQSAAYQREIGRVVFVGTPHLGVVDDSVIVGAGTSAQRQCNANMGFAPDSRFRSYVGRLRADSVALRDLNAGRGRFRPWPLGLEVRNVILDHPRSDNEPACADLPDRGGSGLSTLAQQRFPQPILSIPYSGGAQDTVSRVATLPFATRGWAMAQMVTHLLTRVALPPAGQRVATEQVLDLGPGTSARDTLVLWSVCALGDSFCSDSLPLTAWRTGNPTQKIRLPALRDRRWVRVPVFRELGSSDTTALLLIGRRSDGMESMAVLFPTGSGAPVQIPERPGVFRLRELVAEESELCIQGEGERRVVSILNHCRAVLGSALPPLTSWEVIQQEGIGSPTAPASNLPGRGALVLVEGPARFSLRLESPVGFFPVSQFERFELEVLGRLVADSSLVRLGVIDTNQTVRWSSWESPIRRDAPAGYTRFHVGIDPWNLASELEKFNGVGSLLLHFRGAVPAGSSAEPLHLYLTPVGRGSSP